MISWYTHRLVHIYLNHHLRSNWWELISKPTAKYELDLREPSKDWKEDLRSLWEHSSQTQGSTTHISALRLTWQLRSLHRSVLRPLHICMFWLHSLVFLWKFCGGVSECSPCSFYPFSPMGLRHLALIWGLVSPLTVLCSVDMPGRPALLWRGMGEEWIWRTWVLDWGEWREGKLWG